MEWNEIKVASPNELTRRLQSLREQLRDIRFKVSQGSHKDVRDIRETKLAIARILTRMKAMTKEPITK